MNNRENKLTGRRALGGDGYAVHLRADGKRRAHKASRVAEREEIEFERFADEAILLRLESAAVVEDLAIGGFELPEGVELVR